jgi:mannan endo-1,4-beta-mannosidase
MRADFRHTAVFATFLGLAACGGEAPTWPEPVECDLPKPVDNTGLVQVTESGEFALNGKPYLPRGVNSYPLLQHVGNGQEAKVQDIFAQASALGRALVRTPAFLDIGENAARIRDEHGMLREAGLVALDRVLALAAEQHVRLILILTNNWPDFGGAEAVLEMVAPGEHLPKNAFWSDPRALAAQRAYERALAQRVNTLNMRRYAEDPTIFAWELANEARCEAGITPHLCDRDTLVEWAHAMADELHDAGVLQPVAWGGSGHLGKYGEYLARIADSRAVDILTMHLYAQDARVLPPLPPFETAIVRGQKAIREAAALARGAHLPLLLEEVNWKPDGESSDRDAERATVLKAWLEQARAENVGTLPWMIGEDGRPDYDGYLITPDQVASTAVLRCE